MSRSDGQVTLTNGFIKVVADLAHHSLVEVSADHAGSGAFVRNLLAGSGILFDHPAPLSSGDGKPWEIEIIYTSPKRKAVRFRTSNPAVDPQLGLSLAAGDRDIDATVTFPKAETTDYSANRIRVRLSQFFLLGLFDRGVVQGVAGQKQSFISHDRLLLFYTLDRANGSIAIIPEGTIAETALLSGDGSSYESGIELRAARSDETSDAWQSFAPEPLVRPAGHAAAAISFRLYANDLPFPSHQASRFIDSAADPNSHDSEAYLTAVYGSAAGVLGSYARRGSAYPTLAFPERPYGDAFNFFDPDAWSVVNTLTYSGDPLLHREAREVLERSEAGMLADGQLPHHFEGGKPVYLSIARSMQTGPNIFWVLAATDYVAGSGDEQWLRSHYVHLRKATEWLLAHFDVEKGLLRAEGPLFIDVFRRSGYTLDTNTVAIYLLNRMAETAEAVGDSEAATRYRDFATKLKAAVYRELWNGHDHFVTQRNPDGTTRDFVDYDGNFAALAFGVLDSQADEQTLLRRLDSGPHTHPGGRGTWVSEKRYEMADCYGGNDGDSDTAMARIWWLDMLTRVRMKDQAMFDSLLGNIEGDLLRDVWMPERYDGTGAPAHNGYYHEYPEILCMALREMRYGIHVGLRDVTVHPFGPTSYRFHMGALQVDYTRDKISVQVPGSGKRRYTIDGLRPRTEYTLSTGLSVVTDIGGTLTFVASAGVPVSATRSHNKD